MFHLTILLTLCAICFCLLGLYHLLSRQIYQEGRFPAVDFLSSTSSALNPEVVGEKHYNAVIESQGYSKKL